MTDQEAAQAIAAQREALQRLGLTPEEVERAMQPLLSFHSAGLYKVCNLAESAGNRHDMGSGLRTRVTARGSNGAG